MKTHCWKGKQIVVQFLRVEDIVSKIENRLTASQKTGRTEMGVVIKNYGAEDCLLFYIALDLHPSVPFYYGIFAVYDDNTYIKSVYNLIKH